MIATVDEGWTPLGAVQPGIGKEIGSSSFSRPRGVDADGLGGSEVTK